MNDQAKTQQEQLPEDLLGREALVATLDKILLSDTDLNNGKTIAICGGWGTGKTWLVKKWREHLEKKEQVHVVYLSAWENDYGDDPIVSLLQQIEEDLPEDEPIVKVTGNWFKKNIPNLLLLGTSASSALTGITEIKEMGAALVDMLQKRQKGLVQLKEQLEEQTVQTPLVVFVDELDRCRPLHAIAMLERIKHVFQVPGITFVLSIDKTNLKRSIESVYGKIDAEDYLRRFFDFEYHLRQTSSIEFVTSLFSDKQLDVSDVVQTLLLASNLSLRSIQQVATGIKLVMNSGLLDDVFYVEANGEHLQNAQRLYDQHSEPRGNPSNSANFVDQYVGFDNTDFSSYQYKVPDQSLFIQDFAWGIVAWSIIRKCSPQQPIKSGGSRLDSASRDQATTWEDSIWKSGNAGRSTQSQTGEEYRDRYLLRMLKWLSSMAIHCAELIQINEDKWIAQSTTENSIEEVIWESAKKHFLENTHGIISSPKSRKVVLDTSPQYNTELKHIVEELSGASRLQGSIGNTEDPELLRREIALRALASATIATAKVCQVMRENPDLLGAITGNNVDD